MRPELIKGTTGNAVRSFSNSLLIIQLVHNGFLLDENLSYWSEVALHQGCINLSRPLKITYDVLIMETLITLIT